MKRLSSFLLAGALLAGLTASAQTADELIKKHNIAVGGAETWAKITSFKMDGSTSMQGMDIPLSVTKIRGKGVRTDMQIMGTKCFFIVTPTAGWMFMPVQNMTKPEPLKPDMLNAQQGQIEIGDPLMNAATNGAKVESAGKETVEGKEYYKLTVSDKSSGVMAVYLDPATFYITRTTQTVKAEGKDIEAVSTMSDYLKLPEGVVVPMTMTSNMGTTKISKVTINKSADESIFKPEAGKG